MEFVGEDLRIKFGSEDYEFISVFPEVKVEELSDGDRLVIIKGVYRLRGNSVETLTVSKLV